MLLILYIMDADEVKLFNQVSYKVSVKTLLTPETLPNHFVYNTIYLAILGGREFGLDFTRRFSYGIRSSLTEPDYDPVELP